MAYADSHAHVVDYPEEKIPRVIERMHQKQVSFALAVGVNLVSSGGAVRLAQQYRQLPAAVGIHPWFAVPPGEQIRHRLESLASSKCVKAIGEIGLDYEPPSFEDLPEGLPPMHPTNATKEVQQELLIYELSLARKKGLPVNLHCQGGAHRDMMEILRPEAASGLQGIAHSFNGTSEELHDWLELGFLIAIGPVGLLVNEKDYLPAVIREIPPESLVIETDANPAMAPDGPAEVVTVAEKLAAIRGAAAGEIGELTTANLRRLLRL